VIKPVLSLTTIAPGQEVTLVSIEGGPGLKTRLAEMGLKEGMRIKILHSHRPGPCVILAGETRLVIGRGMAHRVLVKDN